MTQPTESVQCDPADPERLRYLERDRWPEFERDLRTRRVRRFRFDVHHYGMAPQRWEWLVHVCRTWAEVERVLNHYRVDWKRERGEIVLGDATIFRCR